MSTVSKIILMASCLQFCTPIFHKLKASNFFNHLSKITWIFGISEFALLTLYQCSLHWPLSKLRQPRVIAEVIGGIILGPSVMMRIPGFQAAIFPAAAMPNLNLVANMYVDC